MDWEYSLYFQQNTVDGFWGVQRPSPAAPPSLRRQTPAMAVMRFTGACDPSLIYITMRGLKYS